MNYTRQDEVVRPTLEKATVALARFLSSGLGQELERVRLTRAGYSLLSTGCSTRGSFPWWDFAKFCLTAQQTDGGWSDVEETLWCLGYLGALGDTYEAGVVKGRKWLNSVRLPCGAWGRSKRDQPRIPITALASALVPDAVDESGLRWIANQWEADLESPTQLTYKGAFFLLSQVHKLAPKYPNLVERTITFLSNEQEENGGFGPWRGHPVGPDPWTTGVVLWGMSRFGEQVSPELFKGTVGWLQATQLPNGLWPYHYLDDGTSMALIGLSSVLPFLREH